MALARWRPDETRDVTHEDGFGVVIEGGFVWFWTSSGWETQPSEMWAWQFVRGDYGSRVWTPKVEFALDSALDTHAIHSF